MYWIFLIIFVLSVLVPDIIRGDISSISETRVEEIAIFILGVMAIIVFIKKEQIILFQKKEKERDRKKIDQTVKDLVESYSYIGEVNRKMDLIMNIALGLADRSFLNKSKENEIYQSIISAANFLLKADFAAIRFIEISSEKTKKEIKSDQTTKTLKNSDLARMGDRQNIKKGANLVVASRQRINGIKSYLIIGGYDKDEENSPKNLEILKVFVSQALFLYSYTHNPKTS